MFLFTRQTFAYVQSQGKGLAKVARVVHSLCMSATKLRTDEPSPFVRSVASEVSAHMGRHGRMSAAQLSRETGLPYDTLARCLRGARPFTVEELEKIAGALGCLVSDFFREGRPVTIDQYPADNSVVAA